MSDKVAVRRLVLFALTLISLALGLIPLACLFFFLMVIQNHE